MMAVAAIAVLSSCSSDNDIINDNDNKNHNENNKVEAPIFTATIESEVVTRTILVGGTKVNWSNGDKIKINGVEYTTTSTEGTATFTTAGTAPEAIGGKYIAVYPSSIELNAATATVTLPAIQNYDTQTNGISNVPMAAVSTSTALNFKNVCAMLAVTITSGTVKKIKVTADKKNLSGNFILNLTNLSFTSSTGSNSVVLDCDSGVSANNTTFYIAIPPQEYSSLQIYISSDGTTYKEAMATKKAAGLGTLARNTIYPINYEKNAVQLWEDGPYFATVNVGETTETGKSHTYKWGATEAGGSQNDSSYDLDHDTAYKVWGSAWRMPTHDEFTELNQKKSSVTYGVNNGIYGYTFAGASGYGSIFFPVTSNVVGGEAIFWSATLDSGSAYCLFLKNASGLQFVRTDDKGYCNQVFYVRAVLR